MPGEGERKEGDRPRKRKGERTSKIAKTITSRRTNLPMVSVC